MTSHIAPRGAALLVAAALLCLAPRVTARGQSPGKEKQIFVTVLDKSGAAVAGLTAGDITIQEDGAVRRVTAVEPPTEPLFVSLLIDTSVPPLGWDAGSLDVRTALTSFVTSVMAARSDTSISLGEFGGAAVTTVEFTKSAAELRAKTARLFQGQQTGAVLLEALVDASQRLNLQKSPRRAIVSIDFDSPESSLVQPTTVATALQTAGASLWALTVTRSGDSMAASNGRLDAPTRESVLNKLPDVTGGEHLRSIGTSSLESILLKLAQVLTHQYVVTYIRPDAKPPLKITPSSPRGAKTLMSPWVR